MNQINIGREVMFEFIAHLEIENQLEIFFRQGTFFLTNLSNRTTEIRKFICYSNVNFRFIALKKKFSSFWLKNIELKVFILVKNAKYYFRT